MKIFISYLLANKSFEQKYPAGKNKKGTKLGTVRFFATVKLQNILSSLERFDWASIRLTMTSHQRLGGRKLGSLDSIKKGPFTRSMRSSLPANATSSSLSDNVASADSVKLKTQKTICLENGSTVEENKAYHLHAPY